MPDLRFVDAVLDPALIPSVYNGCDQWCDYCPLTARCLAFRCRPSTRLGTGPSTPLEPDCAGGAAGEIYSDIGEALREAMLHLKAAHEARGEAVPVELAGILANDPRETTTFVRLDDPLERMGRRYVMLAAAYLMTRDDVSLDIPKRATGPTPLDLVIRYHMLIAAKIYRAIMSSARAARTGDEGAGRDADLSAKVALLLAERSDEALSVLALDDADARIEHLRAHLRRLVSEVEGRFPGARGVRRPGFDDPSA